MNRLAIHLMVLVACFSAQVLQAAIPDWSEIRGWSTEKLQRQANSQSHARYWLVMAFDGLDLEHVIQQAQPLVQAGTDEATLLQALKCSVAQRGLAETMMDLCTELGDMLTKLEHPLPAARSWIIWANYLSISSKFDESLLAATRAERFAVLAGDRQLESSAQNNIGVDFLILNQPRQALRYLTNARETIGDEADLLYTYYLSVNIASAENELGHYELALQMMEGLQQTADQLPAKEIQLIDQIILASAYHGTGQSQLAADTLVKALDQPAGTFLPGMHAYALSVLGSARIGLGSTTSGLAAYEKALILAVDSKNPARMHKITVKYASELSKLGDVIRAKELLARVVEDTKNPPSEFTLASAFTELALVNERMGNLNDGLDWQRKADKLNSEIYSDHLTLQLDMLHTTLQLDVRNRELSLARQNADSAHQIADRDSLIRNFVVALAISLALVAYLILSRIYQSRLTAVERENSAYLADQVSARTQALEKEMAERLSAEQAQRMMERKVGEAESMRVLGQLTGGVAHDINNLMAVVTLAAELLKGSERRDSDEGTELIDDILKASDAASVITTGLLAYARKQPLSP